MSEIPKPNPRITILRELGKDPDAYVSGGLLSEILGVSRVTVWKYFEQLREEGFEFEAARKRGYRIIKAPLDAHEDWLKALMIESDYGDLSVNVFESIDSTNSEAERWLSTGGQTPHFIIARRQTAGRGRQGRVWHSRTSGNLYLSAVFRPELLPSQMQLFTLWTGLHVARALRHFDERIQVKWPNDLWLEGKKCAGMLTEARIDADRTRDLVFGLGLNINFAPNDQDLETAKLANPAHDPVSVTLVATRVIPAILEAYHTIREDRTSECLIALWPAYDLLMGREVEMQERGRSISGIARGIREDGALRLELSSGETRYLHSGEVRQVRPQR
ncbi:MAG: biotin--[acetyl-CoA-carboxylase] ligase [Verrucomicrobiota bacterium]